MTVARPAVTLIRRRSRQTGASTAAAATAIPVPAAAAAHPTAPAVVPNCTDPKVAQPARAATISPAMLPADADHDRFDGGQSNQLALGGAAGAKQRLLLPAAYLSGRNDGGGQQACQHCCGQPEEQEQDLRVGGVRAGGAQTRAEVVSDLRRAGAAGFEIVRCRGHRAVGGRGMVR